MKKYAILTTIIFVLSFMVQGICMDYYVDAVNGDENNSGMRKDDAFKTITHALIHTLAIRSDPAVIYVAPGNYDTANGESFPLPLKSYVSLKGADKETTIIDGSAVSASIISIKGIVSVKIESLTITGGKGTKGNGKVVAGGGITFENSSDVLINDCIIKDNSADFGGGICLMGYPDTRKEIRTTIANCEISNNSGGFGGGIFSDYRTDLTITHCTIKNNTSNERGGGINCKSAVISYCDITGNRTTSPYGYCGGAGIYLENQFGVKINNCRINSNSSASYGGAIGTRTGYGVSIIDCEIIGNSSLKGGGGLFLEEGGYSLLEIRNCLITDNISQNDGGAISFYTFYFEPMEADPPDSIATLSIINTLIIRNEAKNGSIISTMDKINMLNCTFTDNLMAVSGQNTVNSLDYLTAKNCIFWNNGPMKDGKGGVADIKYSDVEGGYFGKGNINFEPQFVSGPRGDYYLSQRASGQDSDSPCLDVGIMVDDKFDAGWFTNRTDGIFDTDRIDMGFHYQPHVRLGLNIFPHKTSFSDGDNLQILLDIETAHVDQVVNFYIIMKNPAGEISSGMLWEPGVAPAVNDVAVLGGLDLSNLLLLDISLPSDTPEIKQQGFYEFYVVAVSAGSVDFLSNIATVSFKYNDLNEPGMPCTYREKN